MTAPTPEQREHIARLTRAHKLTSTRSAACACGFQLEWSRRYALHREHVFAEMIADAEARGRTFATPSRTRRIERERDAAVTRIAAVEALVDEGAKANRHANGYAYVRVIDLTAALGDA